jgi:hypothetical protein
MSKSDRTRIVCPLAKGGLTITLQASLIEAAKDQRGQDVFRCVLTTDYPGEMVLTYRMGTGHRVTGFPMGKRLPYPCTVLDWERSRPVAPDIKSVLTSIGLDCQTTREMPRDEADACDWLVSEMGLADTGKPGDTLRMLRALNKQLDDLRALLRHTGVDVDHFADWAAGLED